MNREIEFRCYDLMYHEYLNSCVGMTQSLDALGYNLGKFSIIQSHSYCVWQEYINRKDSKKEKIFDGDILECREMKDSNIEYWLMNGEETKPLIVIKWDDTIKHYNCPYDLENWEIVGNIFNNPELLR